MRIAFAYPPITKKGLFPNLPQNRQFIYTASREVRLYPVIMATAATWLRNYGHHILWLDGITRRMSEKEFNQKLYSFQPDLIVLETKAPVMAKLATCIAGIKNQSHAQIVLVGDHSTYYPEESLRNSKADYVLTGGDYDFLMVNLVGFLTQGKKLKPGIYYRKASQIVNTGKFQLEANLDQTPVIDRELTRWKDYGEAYLFHPCAYVMFGRGCGIKSDNFGACTFCIWQNALWRRTARRMSPERAVKEVKNLVNLGIKEIFDDTESGILADKKWLTEFFNILKKDRIIGKIVFSSNARADQLDRATCRLLKRIGYRLVKIGVESGSDDSLLKINKKENITTIFNGVKNAKDADLRVMLTVMFGYPWETEVDAKKTYEFVSRLLFYKLKAGDCLQVSRITPYPGTPLWIQSKLNKWLLVKPTDYSQYDMSKAILKTNINTDVWINKMWSQQSSLRFIIQSLLTLKSKNEAVLLARGAKSLVGHLFDYSVNKKK